MAKSTTVKPATAPAAKKGGARDEALEIARSVKSNVLYRNKAGEYFTDLNRLQLSLEKKDDQYDTFEFTSDELEGTVTQAGGADAGGGDAGGGDAGGGDAGGGDAGGGDAGGAK